MIIEVPTAFSSHIRVSNSLLTKFSYYPFAPLIFTLATKVNLYSHEQGFLSNQRKKMNLLGNGISVDRVQMKKTSNSTKNGLNIIVVASLAPWHGVHILLDALSKINGDIDFYLHIVGDGPEFKSLVNLTHNLLLTDRVKFYGMICITEIEKIYSQCNLAVGSLNWDSIGIVESSPLKHREYSLVGLPFLYIGYDVDFQDSDVAYRLPGIEATSEIVQILYKIDRDDCLPSPETCRRFAEINLTYDAKIDSFIS